MKVGKYSDNPGEPGASDKGRRTTKHIKAHPLDPQYGHKRKKKRRSRR